ncbi:hypothetical protein C8J56DRAFT_1066415 [Mycena floridula]|nr:hypothetical protein C8J56DRAFT_1066415 [Mycena floridula]
MNTKTKKKDISPHTNAKTDASALDVNVSSPDPDIDVSRPGLQVDIEPDIFALKEKQKQDPHPSVLVMMITPQTSGNEEELQVPAWNGRENGELDVDAVASGP